MLTVGRWEGLGIIAMIKGRQGDVRCVVFLGGGRACQRNETGGVLEKGCGQGGDRHVCAVEVGFDLESSRLGIIAGSSGWLGGGCSRSGRGS